VTKDGAPLTLPALTLGDQCVFALKTLDRSDEGILRERYINVRTLRSSIGKVLEAPQSGEFTLRIGANESHEISVSANAGEVKATVSPISGDYELQSVEASAPGCWLLRFGNTDIVPLEVGTNTLLPRSFVRIRPF